MYHIVNVYHNIKVNFDEDCFDIDPELEEQYYDLCSNLSKLIIKSFNSKEECHIHITFSYKEDSDYAN